MIRVSNLASTVRTNVFTSGRFVVTQTVIINGFRFVRIPPSNWSSTVNVNLRPTLSVVNGDPLINGQVNSMTFFQQQVELIPPTEIDRTGGASQYDIYTMSNSSGPVTLLPGTYEISMNSTSANIGIARLDNNTHPIVNTPSIQIIPFPSTLYFVMEIF